MNKENLLKDRRTSTKSKTKSVNVYYVELMHLKMFKQQKRQEKYLSNEEKYQRTVTRTSKKYDEN